MTYEERRKEARKLLDECPKGGKDQIFDLYGLMENEISNGESPDNEFEKFESDCREIIKEQRRNIN